MNVCRESSKEVKIAAVIGVALAASVWLLGRSVVGRMEAEKVYDCYCTRILPPKPNDCRQALDNLFPEYQNHTISDINSFCNDKLQGNMSYSLTISIATAITTLVFAIGFLTCVEVIIYPKVENFIKFVRDGEFQPLLLTHSKKELEDAQSLL